MFTLKNITKSYDDNIVIMNLNLHLIKDEVVSLIGKNGSGKTTLLSIAAGLIKPDCGQIESNGKRVAYLPQHLDDISGNVVDYFDYYAENEIKSVLCKVGLQDLRLEKNVTTLSGGQKTRLALAKMLIINPTVLLLDEPTNNLDLPGLLWLEKFVKNFQGMVLLTSHDRAFLDAVSTKTAVLEGGEIKIYGGNYSFTKMQQQNEKSAYLAKFEAQEKYKNRLESDIANTKNQSISVELTTIEVRTRRYAKKVARKAVVRQARLERQVQNQDWLKKPQQESNIYLPLTDTEVPSGKIVLDIQNVSMGFNGLEILKNISFQLIGNERLHLSGPNGCGKSTLINLILNRIVPDSGVIKIGEHIKIGTLTQDIDNINVESIGKTELLDTKEDPTKCFQTARALGLTISDLEIKVKSLSRGQQTKLALVKVILESPDLLILDEPTNHIELEAREAIESALKNFKGALLIASHDRYFVNNIMIDREVVIG